MSDDPEIVDLPSLRALATSGVYLLLLDGVVVYVGQAVDMRRRIGQHISDGLKDFDAVAFFRYRPDQLAKRERALIIKYAPRYNQCGITKRFRAANDGASRSLPPQPEPSTRKEARGVRAMMIRARQRSSGC
ncbi:GIY-YIG nuclease family protein [Sphingomonas montanisoli]|uniref:GIY-YIG nuclease family protein n=2 Tax=Sphingomonas montanisoli TaxID=2606412 RepID=A0A5D9BZK0_9SPHN|nr:GIY-YIG nuclease family protein [Sphingomonas montanisoli]